MGFSSLSLVVAESNPAKHLLIERDLKRLSILAVVLRAIS
ncbi:hypothetical protein CFSAN001628_018124 [Clostridium botulinum CFSAN001628]|uniref:Uncharacterized protein n=1 Tax=Clostridium botulinum (strain Okra / Type B1) TaxID=498213 RepID=B1IL37_CLOBK|nr:hypothetical protein CLD_1687 [Clostridium botulinum B1 str. Okra]EKX78625.1 hypothetical protein CFSAN001628_018124 [Clostridium botulinum CFSAN001628]